MNEEHNRVNAELIARLRQLADVLEQEDVPDLGGYASLRSSGHIMINESVFRKWFAGQLVRGRKDGRLVNASAEACGITFEALFIESDDDRVRDIIAQL